MKVFELLKNPIIRTIGVFIIIYFGLFHNKKDPESLGNRLSSENIKKNFSEAGEKSRFIISNIRVAQEIAKNQQAAKKTSPQEIFETSTIEDAQIGNGEKIITCGDIAEISYGIYSHDNRKLNSSIKKSLTIGSNENYILEKAAIGMKTDGVRHAYLPKDFYSTDPEFSELLQSEKNGLKYIITILNIGEIKESKISCGS